MRDRCRNPLTTAWVNYGGRGIQFCERWDNFENFLADMGPRPSDNHSIDRINNDGNYEPGNCRWATRKEQQNNRRNTSMVTFGEVTKALGDWWVEPITMAGTTRTFREWAFSRGLSEQMIRLRVCRGQSDLLMLLAPHRFKKSRKSE